MAQTVENPRLYHPHPREKSPFEEFLDGQARMSTSNG